MTRDWAVQPLRDLKAGSGKRSDENWLSLILIALNELPPRLFEVAPKCTYHYQILFLSNSKNIFQSFYPLLQVA